MTETLTPDQFLANVKFDRDGLVAAVAQDANDGRVLMVAWMNAEAIKVTLATRQVTYWSRSRQELWRKGATSGHSQALAEAMLDCDGDTLLLKVRQAGPACHTGSPTCFFRKLEDSLHGD